MALMRQMTGKCLVMAFANRLALLNAFLSGLPACKVNNARERVKLPSFAALELGDGRLESHLRQRRPLMPRYFDESSV